VNRLFSCEYVHRIGSHDGPGWQAVETDRMIAEQIQKRVRYDRIAHATQTMEPHVRFAYTECRRRLQVTCGKRVGYCRMLAFGGLGTLLRTATVSDVNGNTQYKTMQHRIDEFCIDNIMLMFTCEFVKPFASSAGQCAVSDCSPGPPRAPDYVRFAPSVVRVGVVSRSA
jgi:hypothetical protein